MGIRPLQLDVTEGTTNNTTVPTLGKVEDMVAVENLFDRVTGTPNYLKPHTTGDNLHLNDTEATAFTMGELQIFKNQAACATLWSATSTAATDADFDLVRSRGTIASPLAVTDNDIIGSLNYIGASSASNFNNGAQIVGEINGTPSAGVLPCDLVFKVNAGGGVATERMRLVKDGTLKVDKISELTGSAGVTIESLNFDGTVIESATSVTINAAANNDIIITAGLNGSVKMDNVSIFSSTVTTTGGALALNSATNIVKIGEGAAGVDMVLFWDGESNDGQIKWWEDEAYWTFDHPIIVNNVKIDGNTVSSTSGDINITPVAGSDVVIDSHWEFDGVLLKAITDSDTIITAYAGKAVKIEGVAFDGVTLTMADNTSDYIINCTRALPGAGKDFIVNAADAVTTGGPPLDGGDIIFNTGASLFGGADGVFKVDADTDRSIYLGRSKLFSAVTDIAYWSHFDNDNATDYGIKQLASGRVCVNAKAATQVDICVNNVAQVNVDATKTNFVGYINQPGIFAEIYVADASTAQSIATGVTYTKSTAFTNNGQSANCTADVANDKITITQTGKYRVSGSCSATSGKANLTWRGAAFLNGVEQSQVHWKRKMTTTTDSGDMGFTGFIDVTSAPWDLDFRLRHDDGANQNFTIEYANLNVEYIGAT